MYLVDKVTFKAIAVDIKTCGDPLLDLPGLPNHGYNYNTDAPIGGGALLLIGFGAAYALKKRKERK